MKQNSFYLLLWMFSSGGLLAQESTVTSGGSGSGAGGANTYSIGQITYTEISGPTGFTIQGVQQPYEIYVLSGEEHPSIRLEMLVYPNPTQNNIILKIEGLESNSFDYELFDIRGRLLKQNKTNSTETLISLDSYAAGVYILNERKGSTLAKSFKIIKRTS